MKAVGGNTRPLTKRDVRGFLGLTGYYRRFILEYASMSAPLSELVKKNEPVEVVWSDECEKAFEV